jgi:hypothetical protein
MDRSSRILQLSQGRVANQALLMRAVRVADLARAVRARALQVHSRAEGLVARNKGTLLEVRWQREQGL